jgi:hypothetical protein
MTAAFSAEPDLKYRTEASIEAYPSSAWTWGPGLYWRVLTLRPETQVGPQG